MKELDSNAQERFRVRYMVAQDRLVVKALVERSRRLRSKSQELLRRGQSSRRRGERVLKLERLLRRRKTDSPETGAGRAFDLLLKRA